MRVCATLALIQWWAHGKQAVATIARDAKEAVRYGRNKSPVPAHSLPTPNPQVLELNHLPKGLCMKSLQEWPHLSAFKPRLYSVNSSKWSSVI